MDNLSEYIPLLVILAISIISAVGRKKKQGEMQKTNLPGKTVGEIVDKREAEQPSTLLRQGIVEEKPKNQTFKKQVVKAEKEITPFSSAPVFLDVEEETPSFSFEEEDVAKAIIYAEIINKKEW
jgi:hypothetical protein